jgi:hypothetical protein
VVNNNMDALEWLRKQLDGDENDLLREMVREFAQRLMAADVDALTGAGWGEVSPERVNHRNGYRARPFDTRVGTIELAIPKLRRGSYFPDWLLDPRRRSEKALVSVVAECYVRGVSTRRVDGLVETLGIESISKSQVSRMAAELDGMVAEFRNRPLDAGPYTYVWMDALTQKVREGGRIVNVAVVIAVGVNADGHREVLGVDVITTEDGAGWLAFCRGLVARGLTGVSLVVSDAHPGLVDAIAATLPGAAWQRCRTHYLRTSRPRSPSPPRPSSPLSFARSSPNRTRRRCGPSTPAWSNSSPSSFPMPPTTSRMPAETCWPSPRSPRSTGARSGRTTPRNGSTRSSAAALNRPGSDGGSFYWIPTPVGSVWSAA